MHLTLQEVLHGLTVQRQKRGKIRSLLEFNLYPKEIQCGHARFVP